MISTPRFAVENLSKVFYDKALIKQIAVELVANQVEAFSELAADYPGEYGTFDEVKSCIEGGARISAQEYMADLMAEFEEELKAAITATKITLVSASFGDAGLVDINATVD